MAGDNISCLVLTPKETKTRIMRKYILAILILPLSFFSCKEKNTPPHVSDETIILNINSGSDWKGVDIHLFIDSVSFIPLETTEECLIGRISRVLFLDDFIIIHDSKTSSIFLFDTNGKFVRSIGNSGGGPGEYLHLSKIMCDSINKHIIIFDYHQNKIIYHDLQGVFIKEISGFSDNWSITDVINLPNGNFICYRVDSRDESEQSETWLVDSEGKIVKTLIHNSVQDALLRLNYDRSYLYYLSEGKVGLATEYMDDIYHIQEDGDTARKYISFNVEGKNLDDIKSNAKAKFISKSRVHEKGNYVLTEWIGEDMIGFFSLYSKKENTIEMGGIGYHSSILPTISGLLVDTNDCDNLVAVIDSDRIMANLENNYIKENARKVLEKMIEGKSEREVEEMNPVIEIMYLKK